MTRSLKILFALSAWALILALSGYFFLDNVVAYFFGYRGPIFGDSLFNNQLWVGGHMAGGTLILFLGPLQFWNFFRNRFLAAHRVLGKVYMAGVALAGLSALRLSLISPCMPCRISLFILAVLLLLSTALAWITIRRKDIDAHRKFMIRSYICAMAFVTVRIDSVFPLDFMFGPIEDDTLRRVVNEYFFSFVPLIVAEIWMVWLPSSKINKRNRYEKSIRAREFDDVLKS